MTARPAELHWRCGISSGTLPLLAGSYRIGRDGGAEICIPAAGVSKQHALLQPQGRQWWLRDQQSTNGLWWRGRRIRELLLRDGDVVQLGPALSGDQQALAELHFHQPARPLQPLGRWSSAALAAAAALGLALLGLGRLQLPVRSSLNRLEGPLLLYDGNNRPMQAAESARHGQHRSLAAYPPVLVQALLASEDNRFWWHPGVDPIGTLRALATNLSGGRVLEGGSTLTQQLAKNVFLTAERSYKRKVQEVMLAFWLERRFTKDQILTIYLNRVYLGAGTYGVEAASRRYFGKPSRQLTPHEAAVIAGLLKAPTRYSPASDLERAKGRAEEVLSNLVEAGYMNVEEARAAGRDASCVQRFWIVGDPDMSPDGPVLLCEPGLIEDGDSFAVDVRRHTKQRPDGDDTGATDAGHHDAVGLHAGGQRRFGQIGKRIGIRRVNAGALGFANGATVDGHEARAESFQIGRAHV